MLDGPCFCKAFMVVRIFTDDIMDLSDVEWRRNAIVS